MAEKCKVGQISPLLTRQTSFQTCPGLRQTRPPFASSWVASAFAFTRAVSVDPSLPSLATVSSSVKWQACLQSFLALTLLDDSVGA